MKEREFLEKLSKLKESSTKIDISRKVMQSIETEAKLKVLLTSLALFPFFLLTTLELLKFFVQSKVLIIFIELFNITPLILNSPFITTICSTVIASFSLSFFVSLIIQGGERSELLLSSR
jgi:hypothetical protein